MFIVFVDRIRIATFLRRFISIIFYIFLDILFGYYTLYGLHKVSTDRVLCIICDFKSPGGVRNFTRLGI